MTERIDRAEVVRRLRAIDTNTGGYVKALADAVGVDWQAGTMHYKLYAIKCRLANLIESAEPCDLTVGDGPVWPLDADGVPVKPGDELQGYGKRVRVLSVEWHDGCVPRFVADDGNMYQCFEAFEHVKPRTLDDLLADVSKTASQWSCPNGGFADLVREAYELGRAAADD